MVGNDIVDLRDPDADIESYSDRFDERVFNRAERNSIARARAPERQRWRLWAAKEASYKLARQRDGSIVFSPLAFAVDCGEACGAARVRVVHDKLSCVVAFDETKERIHAIAVPTVEDFALVLSSVDTLDDSPEESTGRQSKSARESRAVRELACDAIARRFDYSRGRLEIRKTARRVPRLYHGDDPLDLCVSLSHHGSWLAFACCTGENRGD